MSLTRAALLCTSLALALLPASRAAAPDANAPFLPVAAGAAHELTAPDLEAWLDGLVPTALQTARTPGAVVAVVRDGQVLLEKGYGFADVEGRVAVDPKATLFRPGSTSKLFTWTAVMQLVEQHKLDLDADINKYLDFTIPPRHGKVLTLRDVMTQTSGFEETIKDLLTFEHAPGSLEQVLKSYVPPLRADPGSTAGYSNYATGVAGYIVQRVSGVPYDEYIARNVLAPLGMGHSSFTQPLQPALLAHMAKGYEELGKPGHGYEMINVPPAGSLASTADDMTHFMIAHLQDGRYADARILQPATAVQMHGTVRRLFPDLNGIALGFYQEDINGHRVIAHGGDTEYFHSDLTLFLDDHVGIFVSVNAPGRDGMGEMLRESLFTAFADRYFPRAEPVTPLPKELAAAHARMIAGHYVGSRRVESTFVSLIDLVKQTDVAANPDGTITTQTFGDPRTYVEVKPWLWQQVDGHDKIQAIVQDGRVLRWATDRLAFAFCFEPAQGLAAAGLEMPLCVAALVVVLLAALLWPGALLIRRRLRVPRAEAPGLARARRLADIGAVVTLVATGLWAGLFAAVAVSLQGGLDWLLHLSQAIAVVGFVGGWLATLWLLAMQWRLRQPKPAIAWSALRAVAASYLLWIALAYHLIGVSSTY